MVSSLFSRDQPGLGAARAAQRGSEALSGYDAIAIALHWLMAIVLLGLLVLGFHMVSLPDAGFDTWKIFLILYHKQLGVLALALAVLRLGWRVGHALPALVATLPEWQKVTARFVHLCLYGLMFALPVTGWLMSSAAGFPVSFLGLFELPDVVAPSDYLFRAYVQVHKWLSYALIGLTLAHAGAALAHHFMLKDETLRRIMPGAHWHEAAPYNEPQPAEGPKERT
jgi:cytochrome b561